MILAGPHDRLPSWPMAAPAQPAGSPLFHFPACTSGVLAAIVTQRTHNARGSRRSSATPARRGNRNVQPRLPEIDTGRTLIARSSAGSVGPGERIGQRGGAGEHQQTLADRAQQNTCSVRYGRLCRTTGTGAHSGGSRTFACAHTVMRMCCLRFKPSAVSA